VKFCKNSRIDQQKSNSLQTTKATCLRCFPVLLEWSVVLKLFWSYFWLTNSLKFSNIPRIDQQKSNSLQTTEATYLCRVPFFIVFWFIETFLQLFLRGEWFEVSQ
jgi:hypothetical protein